MKKLEISQMEKIEGGKFWGTGVVEHSLTNGCHYSCQQSYVFWIKVGIETNCTEPVCDGAF